MAGIGQYLKDTRAELHHVAWPTRTQTVVYTILVALISVGVAAYLGIFDYLFTGSLARFLSVSPSPTPSGITITQQPATSTPTPAPAASPTPASFNIGTSSNQ